MDRLNLYKIGKSKQPALRRRAEINALRGQQRQLNFVTHRTDLNNGPEINETLQRVPTRKEAYHEKYLVWKQEKYQEQVNRKAQRKPFIPTVAVNKFVSPQKKMFLEPKFKCSPVRPYAVSPVRPYPVLPVQPNIVQDLPANRQRPNTRSRAAVPNSVQIARSSSQSNPVAEVAARSSPVAGPSWRHSPVAGPSSRISPVAESKTIVAKRNMKKKINIPPTRDFLPPPALPFAPKNAKKSKAPIKRTTKITVNNVTSSAIFIFGKEDNFLTSTAQKDKRMTMERVSGIFSPITLGDIGAQVTTNNNVVRDTLHPLEPNVPNDEFVSKLRGGEKRKRNQSLVCASQRHLHSNLDTNTASNGNATQTMDTKPTIITAKPALNPGPFVVISPLILPISPENVASLISNDPPNTPTTYLSPFVTTSRGKVSARKEKSNRQSLHKFNQTTEETVEQKECKEAAKYMRNQLQIETDRLLELSNTWEEYKMGTNLISEHIDLIDVTIGQTRLLVNKKFKQFAGLIDNCENGTGILKVLPIDLEGFWSMMYLQINHCDERFTNLNKLKANNWLDSDDAAPAARRATRQTKIVNANPKMNRPVSSLQYLRNRNQEIFNRKLAEAKWVLNNEAGTSRTSPRSTMYTTIQSTTASMSETATELSPRKTRRQCALEASDGNHHVVPPLTPRKSILRRTPGSKKNGRGVVFLNGDIQSQATFKPNVPVNRALTPYRRSLNVNDENNCSPHILTPNPLNRQKTMAEGSTNNSQNSANSSRLALVDTSVNMNQLSLTDSPKSSTGSKRRSRRLSSIFK